MRVAGFISRASKLAAVATALALLAGFGGRWAWPLELLANFRIQYGLMFVVCALCLLAVRSFQWLLFAVVGAAFCMLSVLSAVGGPQPDAAIHAAADATANPALRLVTFNVWFRNRDLARAAAYLEQVAADVVILLELNQESALQLQARLPSYRFAQIDPEPHGAVIFSRWPLVEQQFESLCEQCTRVAHARLNWRGREITLLGVHLHWPIGGAAAALRRAELRALARMVRTQPGPVLLGGDFNLTPWSLYFSDFLQASALSDCARGRGWLPTWPAQLAAARIRIDHCFTSQDWHTAAISVGPQLGSDHLPNLIDLRLSLDE